jgi:hypothetical protein
MIPPFIVLLCSLSGGNSHRYPVWRTFGYRSIAPIIPLNRNGH